MLYIGYTIHVRQFMLVSYHMIKDNIKILGSVMKRVERIWIEPSYKLNHMCHISKNLYNETNYMIRQELFDTGRWIRCNELAIALKNSENYKILPAQTSQQIIKYIDRNWKSFFNAMRQYKKKSDTFLERPHIPKYKKKEGFFILIFTNQQVKLKENTLIFPDKICDILPNLPKIKVRDTINNLREVRIVPRSLGFVLEIVYDKIINVSKRDKHIVAGIDLGVRNLATIVDNTGSKPIVIKGGVTKSIIQFYQKEKARLRSIYDLQKLKKRGIQSKRLDDKYEKKMNDYLHKASKVIIGHLNDRDIGLLIIGYNNDWKQESNLGKRTNQVFTMIPHLKFAKILKYKAEEQGIEVVLREEAHTSKCSFFDNETIEHHEEYIGKRKNGLFRTGKGKIVNADVNGGFNITKKEVPNAFQKWITDGIEGVVGHPLRLDVPL